MVYHDLATWRQWRHYNITYRIINFRGSFINVSTVSPTQEVTFTVSITTPVGQHNITLELASGFDGLPLFHICSIDDSILFGENIINTDYTIIKTSTFDNYQVSKNKWLNLLNFISIARKQNSVFGEVILTTYWQCDIELSEEELENTIWVIRIRK
jgi:hypothetical protein